MRQWKISMVKSAMPFTLIQRITRTTVAAAAASASFTRDYRRRGCNHPSCGKKIPTNYHRRDQAEGHPLCIFNPQVAQESMIRKSQVSSDTTLSRFRFVKTQSRIFAAENSPSSG